MIRNPIDAAVYVSPELSTLIENRLNDPLVEQPLTLAQMRTFIADMLPDTFDEAESMHHFDVSESVLDELDALIAEYGEDAFAADFSEVSASEPLSRVIEAVVNDENRENPPTLAAVREAMAAGLVTRLIGEGVLEEDEDEALQAEIQSLIDHFGADALAETYVRFE
jgi:hypothetical protein